MNRIDRIAQELRGGAAATDNEHQDSGGRESGRTRPRPRRSQPSKRLESSRLLSGVRGQRTAVLAAAAVAVLLVVSLAAESIGAGSTHPAPKPRPHHTVKVADPEPGFMQAPAPLDWRPIIEQLDTRRGLVFRNLDARNLLGVDAVPSSASSTDEALVNELRRLHARLRAYPMKIISVEEQYVTVGEKNPRAMLTVIDELGAYDIVDDKGRTLRTVPARGRVKWNVELLNRGMLGWVYVSATRAPKQ